MTVLLREVVGDVLRHARTSQGRTLREVSDSARVSLGYLSEVERGRKEASSELLGAICTALDIPLSRVLFAAGEKMADGERIARNNVLETDNLLETAGTRVGNRIDTRIDRATKVVIPHAVTMAVA